MFHAARALGLILVLAACDGPAEEDPAPPEPVTVMTFNILCSFCDNTFAPWETRLGWFEDVFDRHQPALLGAQEVATEDEVQQVVDRLAAATGATHEVRYYGQGEEQSWPDSLLVWDTARYALQYNGFFWLSPTPDQPFSAGFAPGGQLPRVVAWAVLTEIVSGVEFLFVTTHFDNNSPSQELSAPLFIERLDELAAGRPVLVTGDFNSQTWDPAFETLTEGEGFRLGDAQPLAAQWSIETNLEPVPDYELDGRIDYIFLDQERVTDGRWSVSDWKVDMQAYGEELEFPSDHFAMSSTVQLTP
jgi:endonuclease/exonuclease/phosphatase family metal-dependent hydrolase